MRKHTDPGVAPPAPGSVCPSPRIRPPVPRRDTPAVSYSLTSADLDDDTPTKPDNRADPDLLKLVRLIDSMPPVERRRFVRMSEAFVKCSLGRRVLLEELSCELGSKE